MKRNILKINITHDAFTKLLVLDELLINTENYMGIAYFWAYEYRHLLRDNRKHRVRIHEMLRNAGLNVTEESDVHEQIIKKALGKE